MQTGLCRMRTESLAVALTARRETDFGRQRLVCQNRRYRHLSVRQRRHARYLNRGNARKLRAIRQRPGNAGSHRTAWWAREDSNLQPDRYERSALTIELRARSSSYSSQTKIWCTAHIQSTRHIQSTFNVRVTFSKAAWSCRLISWPCLRRTAAPFPSTSCRADS